MIESAAQALRAKYRFPWLDSLWQYYDIWNLGNIRSTKVSRGENIDIGAPYKFRVAASRSDTCVGQYDMITEKARPSILGLIYTLNPGHARVYVSYWP